MKKKIKSASINAILAILFFTIACNSEKVEFALAFPPYSNQDQYDFTLGHMQELNVSKLRIMESWDLREQNKGEFDWGPLDARINFAEANGLKLLITLSINSPDWACSETKNEYMCLPQNFEDYRNYIATLLKRYPNKIDKLMFENEWDSHWAGTPDQYIELNNMVYDEIKKHSPDTISVLGSFTRGFPNKMLTCDDGEPYVTLNSLTSPSQQEIEEYCANEFIVKKALIQRIFLESKYDIAAFHLYDEVDRWDDYLRKLREFTDKPVIITEFGGPNLIVESCSTCPHPYTDQYHSDQLKKYMEKLSRMDVKEAYYFKLVEGGPETTEQHKKSGLLTQELEKKPGYYEFQRIN